MSEITTSSDKKISVLVADDSRIMRFAINKMLHDDYELVEVDNGEKAWQQLLHNDAIKILLTDLQMPVVDGYELIDRLRKPENPPHLRDMPVIVLSSFDKDDTNHESMRQGTLEYVAKPFNSTQIKDCVRSLLDQAIAEDAAESTGNVDKVTGLSGWEHFNEKGSRDLAYVRRESKDISLVLIEVDRVSELIVEYGHSVLDRFLNSLGGYLQEQVRTLDTISRISPYRFGVILPLTNDLGAVEMAQRVMDKVRSLSSGDSGRQFKFSMSIGIAAPRVHHCRSFNEIMDIASRRLAMAIDFGGNTMIYEDQPYQNQQKKSAVKNITDAAQVKKEVPVKPVLLDQSQSQSQQREKPVVTAEPTPASKSELKSTLDSAPVAVPKQKSEQAVLTSVAAAVQNKVLEFSKKMQQLPKTDKAVKTESQEQQAKLQSEPLPPKAQSEIQQSVQPEQQESKPVQQSESQLKSEREVEDSPQIEAPLESKFETSPEPKLEPQPASQSEQQAEQTSVLNESIEEPILKATAATASPKPSLDTALWLLDTKQTSQIDMHLNELLEEVLPLLEHADKILSLQLDDVLKQLKQQLVDKQRH